MSRAETIAKELTKAERRFILNGPGAPVPDIIWSGRHFDLIEFVDACMWRRSALYHEVAKLISKIT